MDQTPPSDGFPLPPVQAQVVPQASAVRPPRKSRFFARLFMTLLVFLFLGSLALNLLLLVAVGLTGLASAEDEGRVRENSSP